VPSTVSPRPRRRSGRRGQVMAPAGSAKTARSVSPKRSSFRSSPGSAARMQAEIFLVDTWRDRPCARSPYSVRSSALSPGTCPGESVACGGRSRKQCGPDGQAMTSTVIGYAHAGLRRQRWASGFRGRMQPETPTSHSCCQPIWSGRVAPLRFWRIPSAGTGPRSARKCGQPGDIVTLTILPSSRLH